jgi:hypothetical protein
MMLKVLSKREKNILYSTIGVILFAIVFNLLLYPFFSRNARLNKEIELTRGKLKNYYWLLSQKEAIMSRYSKFNLSSATAQEDPIVSGLRQLEDMAKDSGIRIIDIRPEQAPAGAAASREASIELRAEGLSADFLKFLYDIEESLSLLRVRKFQLTSRANTQALEGRFTIALLFAPD